jgi:hypothetical protein
MGHLELADTIRRAVAAGVTRQLPELGKAATMMLERGHA